MRIMGKGGQFYLMAAIIIIALLSGLAFVFNYSNTKIQTQSFYVKQELGIEGEKVLDYALKNGVDSRALMENFTKSYSNNSEEGDSFYFLFGNRNQITVAGYKKSSDGIFFVDIGDGNGNQQLDLTKGQYSSWNFSNPETTVNLTVNGIEYPYMLTPGENFYFVISKDVEEEKYVFYSYNSNLSGGVSQQASCGNSIIEAGEQCDDGNTINGDGCSSTCQIEQFTQLTCRKPANSGAQYCTTSVQCPSGSQPGDITKCSCHWWGGCKKQYDCYYYETTSCLQNPQCSPGYGQISITECTP